MHRCRLLWYSAAFVWAQANAPRRAWRAPCAGGSSTRRGSSSGATRPTRRSRLLRRDPHLAQGDESRLPGLLGRFLDRDRAQAKGWSAAAAGTTTSAWPPGLDPADRCLRVWSRSSESTPCTVDLGAAGHVQREQLWPSCVCAALVLSSGPSWRSRGRFAGTAGGSTRWSCSGCISALALGIGVGLVPPASRLPGVPAHGRLPATRQLTWRDGADLRRADRRDLHGLRRVLLRVAALLLAELIAIRGRRLFAIARLSIYESNRRMWAPWVVITVFLLVLAFTALVPPASPRRRDGPALRRHAQPALLGALDGDGHDPDTALAADGHPAADDLHGRLQAGAAARADLGPDDRLHGAGDRAGRRSSAGSACSTSGAPSAPTITNDRRGCAQGQEREAG